MIFLDNASTTKPYKEVLDIVNYYNDENFYNAGAIYTTAFKISTELKKAKESILNSLGARKTDNFIFTSGATESNNMVLRAFAKKNNKILVSVAEHPAIYNTALDLKNAGFNVDFVKVTSDGVVDEADLLKKLTDDVALVSIIHVNNETGAVNDIKKLVSIVKHKNKNILFHSDGVQAFGKIPVNLTDLGVDFYTISGHKIHCVKGIGGLFVKDAKHVKPLITGGGQQDALRSGTENVSGMMALKVACEMAKNNQKQNYENVTEYKKYLLDNLDYSLPYKVVNNGFNSPYIAMICCTGCRAETLVHMMEDDGVLVGNGSACSSKKKENRNLAELGYSALDIEGAVRISFSDFNTLDEVKFATECLNKNVKEYLQKVR